MRRIIPGAILVLVIVAACGSSIPSTSTTVTINAGTAQAATQSPASSGLSVGDACGMFHTANQMMSAAGVSNLTAMKSYGEQLVRESAQMMKEHPDPDPSLANALGQAGTANLAVALGFLPKGLAAGLDLAAADVGKVTTLCREAGFG